jgi:hypothetical protein
MFKMTQSSPAKSPLQDVSINTKLKLSALWIAATLCYAYADILAFYRPGVIDAAAAGKMGPLGSVTQGILASVAVFMSVPAVMVVLSLCLRASLSRWLNIVVAAVYTLVIILTAITATWWFYRVFAAIEVALTSYLIWLACRWPRDASRASA